MPHRQDNLIPIQDVNARRTREEREKSARKAGVASGKARRKKANLKKTMETILALELPEGGIKEKLHKIGLDPSCENGLVMSVVMRAIVTGDHSALQTITRILEQDRSTLDRKEQRTRINRSEVETERIEGEIARRSGTAGAEQAEQQAIAIADMINTPAAERALKDFLAPEEEQGGGDNE